MPNTEIANQLNLSETAIRKRLKRLIEDEIIQRLKSGEVDGVADALIDFSPSRHVVVVLAQPIAKDVLKVAWKYCTSRYLVTVLPTFWKVAPLLIRVQSVILGQDPTLGDWLLRLIPGRAGPDTAMRMLNRALREVMGA